MKLKLKRHPDTSKIIGIHPNHIDAYDVGSIRGVTNLIPPIPIISDYYDAKYFTTLCDTLIQAGYKDKETLYGMSYDFRRILDPEYRAEWFVGLKSCIENSKIPPLIIAHSLGAILFKWFIETQSQEWARKKLFHNILVSAGFAGCSYALRAVITGDHFISGLAHKTRDALNHNSGVIMCLPNFASDNYMIINKKIIHGRDSRHYKDLIGVGGELYADLYKPHISQIFLQRPDISMDLIQTVDEPTPLAFISDDGKYSNKTIYTYGDGLITERSLSVAARIFPNASIYNIPYTTHTKILMHPRFIERVFEVLYFDVYDYRL